MKKINSILLILAAAAGFTNCSKAEFVENQEAENGGTVVYATTDAVTKTTLSNDYNVLWSEEDQIEFFKEGEYSNNCTFSLSSGAGTTTGTFECQEELEDGEYTVYYPLRYGGTDWPAQTYVSATDISGAPMKATATVTNGKVSDISFKNVGGILRYTVKGDKTIKSINVKSGSPALDVTLDCGDGIALTSEGTVFNIALLEGEYSNATLTFTATDNTAATKTAASFVVKKNYVSLATFDASKLSFVAPPVLPDGALSGVFSVSDTKKVHFSKGNLWYGKVGGATDATWNFETDQYDISSSWNESHVSNFYWSNTDSEAYSEYYNGSTGNVLFTNEDETTPKSDFTVNGNAGVWRTLSQAEWKYLLEERTMTNGKDRYSNAMEEGVTIGDTICKGIFLYPDNYNGDIVSVSITLEQINAAGIVFLPNTGYRNGDYYDGAIQEGDISCIYWTSTADSDDEEKAYRMFFQWDDSKSDDSKLSTEFNDNNSRAWAVGIRLVTDI